MREWLFLWKTDLLHCWGLCRSVYKLPSRKGIMRILMHLLQLEQTLSVRLAALRQLFVVGRS